MSYAYNELYHHGIKGQRWGIRRYQNPDGSLTPAGRKRYSKIIDSAAAKTNKFDRVDQGLTRERIIPKGTKMYRTTVNPNETLINAPIYVSYTDVDRQHYRAGWIRTIGGGKTTYENTYTLSKDLRIPSRDTVYKAVYTVLKDPVLCEESLQTWFNNVYPKGSNKRLDYADRIGVPRDKIDLYLYNTAKNIVKEFQDIPMSDGATTALGVLGVTPNVKKALIANLSAQGYNAIADEASIGGHTELGKKFDKEGIDPLIIFDANDSLIKNATEEITSKKEQQSYRKYVRWDNAVRRNTSAKWSEF